MNDFEEIISSTELCKILKVSKSTLWRMRLDGLLPPPIQISVRIIGWERSVIDAWQVGTRWPPIEDHFLQWIKIVKGYVISELSAFNNYANYLANNELVVHFWIHLIIPILASSLVGGFLAFKFVYVEGGLDKYKFRSGVMLLPNKQAVKYHKRKLRRQNLDFALPLHPLIYLPVPEQVGNIFISGSQGAEKSTVLKAKQCTPIHVTERCLNHKLKSVKVFTIDIIYYLSFNIQIH